MRYLLLSGLPGRIGVTLGLLSLGLSTPALGQSPWRWVEGDTTIYANEETARVITLARARHYYRDSLIEDFTVMTHTRIDVGFGRSRYSWIPPFVAQETVARVRWQDPGDLRIQVLGERRASRMEGVELEAVFDRPWFVPRAIGDSIRLLEGDFPEAAAVHPLSEGGPEFYRYEIIDSLSMEIPGRVVRAVGVRVEPRIDGNALVAGDMWLDADTYELVRLTVSLVGTMLWEVPDADDAGQDLEESRRENELINRILSARTDLEYGLFEGRFWLPYRQLVTLTVELPWILDVKIPIRFATSFADYEINTSRPIEFAVSREEILQPDPDSERKYRAITRCPDCAVDNGGPSGVALGSSDGSMRREVGYLRAAVTPDVRWEMEYPPRDSLERYGWRDELSLDFGLEQERRLRDMTTLLARVEEGLDDDLVGRRRHGIAWQQLADAARFNRVQGFSVGLGYEWKPGPRFVSLFAEGRFGLGDLRPTGALAFVRDDPAAKLEVRGFRTVGEAEPWTRGQSLGNSLNAFFAGHDDAEYYLRLGTSAGLTLYDVPTPGRFGELDLSLAYERHRSMITEAGSGWEDLFGGDGFLGTNRPATEDDFFIASAVYRPGLVWSRVSLGTELWTAGDAAARYWLTARTPLRIAGRSGTVTLRGGTSSGTLPIQARYRVGGPFTVRGQDYGTRLDDGFWSAQLDFGTGRGPLSPVVFFDIGDDLTSGTDPLMGAGIGFSLMNGWIRPNLSYGIQPDEGLRFDLLFGAPR